MADQTEDATVDIIRDSVARIDIVFSQTCEQVLAKMCGHALPDGMANVLLRVQAADGSLVPSATVAAVAGSHLMNARKVNDNGSFVICGVTWDVAFRLTAGTGEAIANQVRTVPRGVTLDTLTVKLLADRHVHRACQAGYRSDEITSVNLSGSRSRKTRAPRVSGLRQEHRHHAP